MRNSPGCAIRQWCRFGDRRGFTVPTVAPTGGGAEFSDRSSAHWMAHLAYCWVTPPIGAEAGTAQASTAEAGAVRQLASGDRAALGIDLSVDRDRLIRHQLDGSDPKRQSGRDRHRGFP
jgi:hypothetical protein